MAEITEGVQITVKVGRKGHLFTFGSTTAEGFKKVVDELFGENVHSLILDDAQQTLFGNEEETAAATSAVQSGLGSTPGLGNKAPAAGGAPSCAHGARTTRNGTNARGAWTGHFCPLPKGDPNQCKPIFE